MTDRQKNIDQDGKVRAGRSPSNRMIDETEDDVLQRDVDPRKCIKPPASGKKDKGESV